MNAKGALEVVNSLAFTLQRMRSISAETVGTDEVAQLLLQDLNPYVFGPKSLLPALSQLQDRGSVTPIELYNLCVIAHDLEPAIAQSAALFTRNDHAVPPPSSSWLSSPW